MFLEFVSRLLFVVTGSNLPLIRLGSCAAPSSSSWFVSSIDRHQNVELVRHEGLWGITLPPNVKLLTEVL